MQRDDVSASVKLYLRLSNAEQHASGLGRGVIQICQRVERLGSLNRAAKDMGMAYSKAWRIVKNTEESLGIKLFIRQGANGSTLTKEAKALVEIFCRVERDLTAYANKLLDDVFEEYADAGLFLPDDARTIETQATPELIAQVRSIERHIVTKLKE